MANFKKTPRLQDFTTSGVKSGTFPNAAGRGERISAYYAAVEKDLAAQHKARTKTSGKPSAEKISPRAKPMKPIPPGQS